MVKRVNMADRLALPEHVKPADLAEHIGASERTLREFARAIGACRIIGKAMIFLPEDVEALLEAAKPCSKSTSAAKSGTTAVPLPEGDFAALQAQRTKAQRKGSRRKSKPANGEVILMGRART